MELYSIIKELLFHLLANEDQVGQFIFDKAFYVFLYFLHIFKLAFRFYLAYQE